MFSKNFLDAITNKTKSVYATCLTTKNSSFIFTDKAKKNRNNADALSIKIEGAESDPQKLSVEFWDFLVLSLKHLEEENNNDFLKKILDILYAETPNKQNNGNLTTKDKLAAVVGYIDTNKISNQSNIATSDNNNIYTRIPTLPRNHGRQKIPNFIQQQDFSSNFAEMKVKPAQISFPAASPVNNTYQLEVMQPNTNQTASSSFAQTLGIFKLKEKNDATSKELTPPKAIQKKSSREQVTISPHSYIANNSKKINEPIKVMIWDMDQTLIPHTLGHDPETVSWFQSWKYNNGRPWWSNEGIASIKTAQKLGIKCAIASFSNLANVIYLLTYMKLLPSLEQYLHPADTQNLRTVINGIINQQLQGKSEKGNVVEIDGLIIAGWNPLNDKNDSQNDNKNWHNYEVLKYAGKGSIDNVELTGFFDDKNADKYESAYKGVNNYHKIPVADQEKMHNIMETSPCIKVPFYMTEDPTRNNNFWAKEVLPTMENADAATLQAKLISKFPNSIPKPQVSDNKQEVKREEEQSYSP